MRKYTVTCCALRERDLRLLQIIASLPVANRFEFLPCKTAVVRRSWVALIDTGLPLSQAIYREMRERDEGIVPVAIVDAPTPESVWRFSVQRSSLLRSILKVLNGIVELEFSARRVPAAALPSPAQSPAESVFAEGSPLLSRPLRALVVDDSLAVRKQVCEGLGRLGLACDEATDAEQAQAALARESYDIALLDVVMPGIDGYELCRRIRRTGYGRTLPVVMLTSRGSPFDQVRGVLAGCDTYLTKPITWDAFRAAIDKALLKNANGTSATRMPPGYAARSS